MSTAPPLVRELTYSERMTWGECPVCKAGHGEWCHAEIGFHVGIPAGGGRMQTGDGVHQGRLARAPVTVNLVGVD